MASRFSLRAFALASTALASAPSLAQEAAGDPELRRLQEAVAAQTLRLDEAEQTISKLRQLTADQAGRIGALERELGVKRAAAANSDEPHGVYIVQAGDTLHRIARNAGVTVQQLMRDNAIKSPRTLKIGQPLVIPGGAEAAARVAGAADPAITPQPPRLTAPAVVARAEPAPPPGPAPQSTPQATPQVTAQAAPTAPSSAAPSAVGRRPENDAGEPVLTLAADVGGVLTPKGTLYFEPELDFAQTSENRFFFSGTEILDAILIGVIEATDTDRMSLVARGGLRYGVTDRFEVDARIPLVYRDDRIAGVALDDSTEFVRDLTGAGLGDIEIGAHYQLTNGAGFPYTIANIRAKAPTGEGPFEVDRSPSGVELDAATGSGFWTVEPSATFIFPTDPAVFFANFGYQMNFEVSPDEPVGSSIVRKFDPGDAIRASLGVGLSVNERLSLNFGYDYSRFFRTRLLIESVDPDSMLPILTDARQPSVTVGSFGIGGSYFVNDALRLSINTSFGATDEAPDMRLLFRAQVKLAD
jgi:LysM repeat protein